MSNALNAGFLLVCTGAALVIMAYGPAWTGAPPWPTPAVRIAPTVTYPHRSVIRGPNMFGAYCAETPNLIREVGRQKPNIVDNWMRDGHVWFLETGATVDVLQAADDLKQIRAVGGPNDHRPCWTSANAVR